MEKLLIIGVDTMLGANLALSLEDQFEIVGVPVAGGAGPAGIATRTVGDVTPQRIRSLLNELHPDWMIHAGHLARSSWDNGDAKLNWQQEATLVGGLAALAQEAGVPFCFLSTDAVFAGPRLFHEESARATGATALGVAARQAEAAAAACGALVVRTHAYGWGVGSEPSLIDGLWKQINDQQRGAADARHYVTPILASDLAQFLVRGFARKLHGLYHVTGAERTNRVRFASELAAAAGCEFDSRSPSSAAELSAGPATETSLNTRRARRDFEAPLPLLREGLERLAAQRVNGYLDRLQSAGKKKSASHAA